MSKEITQDSQDRRPLGGTLTGFGYRIVMALVIIAIVLLLFRAKALSQDVRRGEVMARTWCASCHNVERDGPTWPNQATPSFAALARRPDISKDSLETFLRSSHPHMPTYGLMQKQVPYVAAYIASLKTMAAGPGER